MLSTVSSANRLKNNSRISLILCSSQNTAFERQMSPMHRDWIVVRLDDQGYKRNGGIRYKVIGNPYGQHVAGLGEPYWPASQIARSPYIGCRCAVGKHGE